MNEENTFTIINDEGKEIKCEVLFTYEDDSTGMNFIAYTDNSLDTEGNTNVFASIFDPKEDDPELIPITEERDWKLIESLLQYLTSDEEG